MPSKAAARRRADDLVMTISDDDVPPQGWVEEAEVEMDAADAPSQPKSNAASFHEPSARSGKGAKPKLQGGVMANPLFHFDDLSTPATQEKDHIWDFDATKKALRSENKPKYTPIDEIIRKNRRVETEAAAASDPDDASASAASDQDDVNDDDFSRLADQVRRHDRGAASEDSDEASDNEAERQRKAAYFAPDDESSHLAQSSFANMNLSRPLLRSLTQVGFTQPTLIQAKAIPVALLGRDVCGGAVTGSGKTAAFVVPMIERLLYRPRQEPVTRVLILCPTRELAIQCHAVATKLAAFTDIQFCLCVGGLSLKGQEAELRKRPDVVIATPGRLIDHLRNSTSFTLADLDILVMDEADRMLEDGFKDELTEIVRQCPRKRQTMLFSATMTDNVDELIRLSLQRPVRLLVDSTKATAEGLVQEFIRIRQHREHDRAAYLVALCMRTFKTRCIIFFRSKVEAHRTKILFGLLGMNAAEIHGNLSQEQRLVALEQFRDGQVDYMMATDLAARGLDIKGIDTVINFSMPASYTQYLHRIGRTARAGRAGRAVTLAGEDDRKVLRLAIKNSPPRLVQHRVIPNEVLDHWCQKVAELGDTIDKVLAEEKEDRVMRQAEMELRKAENLIKHQDEIMSRPRRTWFQSKKEKEAAAARGSHAQSTEAEAITSVKSTKRQLPPTAGMSRKKRRRFEHAEEDRAAAKVSKAAVRAAKQAQKPGRLRSERAARAAAVTGARASKPKSTVAAKHDGVRLSLTDAGNRAAGPKSEAARSRLVAKEKRAKAASAKGQGKRR